MIKEMVKEFIRTYHYLYALILSKNEWLAKYTMFSPEVTEAIANRLVEAMAKSLENKSDPKNLALTFSYLNFVKRNNSNARVLSVLGQLICLTVFAITSDRLFITFALILASIFFLIKLKEFVLEYRIKKGLFGNDEHEVKDLIYYIIENSDDIDFNDGDGNLRKALKTFEESDLSRSGKNVNEGVAT